MTGKIINQPSIDIYCLKFLMHKIETAQPQTEICDQTLREYLSYVQHDLLVSSCEVSITRKYEWALNKSCFNNLKPEFLLS